MRTRSGLVFSSLALALTLAGPAFAQQNRTATPPPQQQRQLSQKDMNFVKEAAIGGMAEVELGNLAQQNAQSDQVKQFGARMVRDHSAANNQLTNIVAGKAVALPQQLDQKHAQMREKLANLRGPEFDRAYMRGMVEDHDKTVKLFRDQVEHGADPDLKGFAKTTLVTIEEHDKMAHDLMKSLATVSSSQPAR